MTVLFGVATPDRVEVSKVSVAMLKLGQVFEGLTAPGHVDKYHTYNKGEQDPSWIIMMMDRMAHR